MTQIILTADDHRRAAALVIHHGTSNIPGINAILDESEHRSTELLLSLLSLYSVLVPELRTRTGQKFLADYLLEVAGLAADDLNLDDGNPQ